MSKLLPVLMLVVASSFGCASIRTVPAGRFETVTLDQLSSQGERLAPKVMGDGVIVHVEKGQQIPLEFTFRTSVLSAETKGGTVTAQRELFLLISREGLLMSPDGARFAAVQDQDALKKLFGLNGGQFALGLGATKEEGAKVVVRIEER